MGLLVLALLSSATHGLGEYAIAHLHRPTASSASTVGPDLVERLPTETDCGGPWIYASVCRDAHVLQQPFMCQVCRSWAALDRVVSAHNRNATKLSRLSGGISLHQAQLQAVQTIQIMQPIIKRNGAATVCETGFNAGHSTLLFLALAYADARSSWRQRAACPHARTCTVHARYEPRAGGLYVPRIVWHHRRYLTRPSSRSTPFRRNISALRCITYATILG